MQTTQPIAATPAGHEEAPRSKFLQSHFPDMAAQLDTAKLGMWFFLASELLFFGGLFTAYGVYRGNNPEMFQLGQHFLDWRMGALNTAVLITSSLTAAWAVRSAQLNDRRGVVRNVLITLACAATFMVVKYFEYSHKLHNGIFWGPAFHPSEEILRELPAAVRALPFPPNQGVFFTIYFVMTGLHGIHVLIGMGLYGWVLRRALRGDFSAEYYTPVDIVALYWHLVDLIWIFLFPLFYLIG